MESMRDHKSHVRAQFGATAASYVTSATHAGGADLEQIAAWCEGNASKVALDVATGGGHTAAVLARNYGRVVATDLTASMLAAAAESIRGAGLANVTFSVADAEQLPFASASIDAVACRIAPHHFARVASFVAEVARVLVPGGIFLLEDSCAPEEPVTAAFLNVMEALRDPTHVRSLRQSEWRDLLRATDLDVEEECLSAKTHLFEQWVTRSRTPAPARARLRDHIRGAPAAAREALALEYGPAGEFVSYTDHKVLFKSRRTAR